LWSLRPHTLWIAALKHHYLESPIAKARLRPAYLYLARRPGDTSARALVTQSGDVIDFAADDRAIGMEIPSPATATIQSVNEALRLVSYPPILAEDLKPLRAA